MHWKGRKCQNVMFWKEKNPILTIYKKLVFLDCIGNVSSVNPCFGKYQLILWINSKSSCFSWKLLKCRYKYWYITFLQLKWFWRSKSNDYLWIVQIFFPKKLKLTKKVTTYNDKLNSTFRWSIDMLGNYHEKIVYAYLPLWKQHLTLNTLKT